MMKREFSKFQHHENPLIMKIKVQTISLIKKRRMGESGVSNGIAMLAQNFIVEAEVQSVTSNSPGLALKSLPVSESGIL
jgi:hypothetical protein